MKFLWTRQPYSIEYICLFVSSYFTASFFFLSSRELRKCDKLLNKLRAIERQSSKKNSFNKHFLSQKKKMSTARVEKIEKWRKKISNGKLREIISANDMKIYSRWFSTLHINQIKREKKIKIYCRLHIVRSLCQRQLRNEWKKKKEKVVRKIRSVKLFFLGSDWGLTTRDLPILSLFVDFFKIKIFIEKKIRETCGCLVTQLVCIECMEYDW